MTAPDRFALAAGAVVAALAMLAACASAATPQELLDRAAAERRAAEAALAEARTRRLEQRKALAAEVQAAYDALAAARRKAHEAETSLQAAREELEDAAEGEAVTQHRIANFLAGVAEAAGRELDANAPADIAAAALWSAWSDRLARLEGASELTVARGRIVARDGSEADAPIFRLGAFAAYACGPDSSTLGLLRDLPDGRRAVAGPRFPGSAAAALRDLAAGEGSHVPLDASGTLIDRPDAEAGGFGAWLAAGGPFIVPILAVGGLGLLLIADRILFLLRTKAAPGAVSEALARLEAGDGGEVTGLFPGRATPTSRVILAGARAAGLDREHREAAMESALLAEAPRLERSLSLLGALAGVAPLLGLLGTVSGMIGTFDTISTVGTGNPRLLSGGISEALITTQLGLMVAIPLLLAHAWISRWVQRREAMLECTAIEAFGCHAPGGEGGAP